MTGNFVKNGADLARTKERSDALEIVEAGLKSIDTGNAIREKFYLEGDVLHADGKTFDLNNFERVKVFAFGKASVDAVKILEEILGDKITSGVALDKKSYKGNKVEVFEGTHPLPTKANAEASARIANESKELSEKDLAVVVVSGGGSALLCYPEMECDQGSALYKAFLGTGGSIRDINIVRKHISDIKGGGLAKFLYPATVISLVLCDVSGEYFEEVASGPTYQDKTSIEDAKNILEKFNIKEEFVLNETPKDDKYFEKVLNIPIVSNVKALNAMKEKAESLGYKATVLGSEFYNEPTEVMKQMLSTVTPKSVVLGGGEPSMKIFVKGSGGRNQYTVVCALKEMSEEDVFVSFASDGIDNQSKYAGAISDKESLDIVKEKNIDIDKVLVNFDTEPVFVETKDLIETGETGSNVSDLFFLLRK